MINSSSRSTRRRLYIAKGITIVMHHGGEGGGGGWVGQGTMQENKFFLWWYCKSYQFKDSHAGIQTNFCRFYGINWVGECSYQTMAFWSCDRLSNSSHAAEFSSTFGSTVWQFIVKVLFQQLERFIFSLKWTVYKEVITKRD